MLNYGYGGRILRINLTNKSFKIEPLDKKWISSVIGGRAANTKRLYEELNFDCDPLGSENLLMFGVGPLTGSILPASAYFTVTAKSPLTGILGDSAAGGSFGPEMKLTGFDQIIITGKADKLLYLFITDMGVEFVDCPDFAGKTIVETTASIRKRHKDYGIQVAAIGPAGEHQVLYSTIVSSGNRVNGRTGMGAVMGSKNVKAIAVRGSRIIEFAEPLEFMEEVKKIEQAILEHDEYQKRYHQGTTMLMSDLNSIGILPTNHFLDGVCDYLEEISGETLAQKYKVKNKACFNCNLHCSRYYLCEGIEAEGPEYETLCSFTSKIGNNDLPFALEMNNWLNQMGLDSISTSEVIAWIIECQEKGLIKPEDVGGFKISWGEIDKIREIVKLITFREGIGNQLADGARNFSRQFSGEAQKLVLHVKGLDIINGDPRGIKAYGLTYAIASRGGDHLRAEPFFELTNRKEEAKKRFGTEKAADRLAEEGKAALVTYSEKIALLTDSMTMCKNIGLCMDILNFENASKLLITATGMNYSPKHLQTIMQKSINLQFRINQNFGLLKEDDTLPDRFIKESLPRGPTKGSTINIQKMVEEYYQLHDWYQD
ncbi:MAG: aldehyde:ferredoxin oxidoreductase [Candidatus Heimdallarchaeota archaeon]|nr:aldehyde:ferredoxin oxidoreductase [Candidatus Heimdallarchaeota archaeon]